MITLADFYVRDGSEAIVEPVVLAYANSPTELATRKFMMYHIQLPAFRREHKTLESVRNDAFFTWLYALDQGYKNPDEMEALSEMSEGLRNFAKRYNYAINDPELIRRYRMVEDGRRDVATRIAVAEARGIEIGEARGREIGEARGREIGEAKGREIGEARKNRENARAMRNAGIDVALIAQITGLDEAEIEAL